ncbi:MAG: DUF6527 family protein [Candidatus Acidiferrales bacterium]
MPRMKSTSIKSSTTKLTHKFVTSAPEQLEDRTLYISMEYASVIHKCCCGCGQEVVTPLSPTDWKLIFDGKTVSLDPSIGNWSFTCQSHYWIRNNTVQWAAKWTKEQIRRGQAKDRLNKKAHYKRETLPSKNATP